MVVIHLFLLKLFILHHLKSDFDETCHEQCYGKWLQQYTADLEYLHKLG